MKEFSKPKYFKLSERVPKVGKLNFEVIQNKTEKDKQFVSFPELTKYLDIYVAELVAQKELWNKEVL